MSDIFDDKTAKRYYKMGLGFGTGYLMLADCVAEYIPFFPPAAIYAAFWGGLDYANKVDVNASS
jgi:hypothetical protein